MKSFLPRTLLAALAVGATIAQATPVVVNVAGAQSVNLQGEAGNTVWLVDIGAFGALTSLDWQVVLDAFAPSSRSEMQVSFGSASGLDLVTLTPGQLDNASGPGSYSGSLDLTPFNIAAGADGLLRIEFSEAYKDLAVGTSEGVWTSGTLTFDVSAVPEPASAVLSLLGLGLLGVRLRRGLAA